MFTLHICDTDQGRNLPENGLEEVPFIFCLKAQFLSLKVTLFMLISALSCISFFSSFSLAYRINITVMFFLL